MSQHAEAGSRRRLPFVSAAVAALALASGVGSARALPVHAASASAGTGQTIPAVPACIAPSQPTAAPRIAWGIYGTTFASVTNAQQYMGGGKCAAIVMWYQHWGGSSSGFDQQMLDEVFANGSAPMITWMSDLAGFSDAQIAAGSDDTYITTWARDLKADGRTVYLNLDHEMNGTWYTYSPAYSPSQTGDTAADFVSMWTHVWTIFHNVGAGNVRWVWAPNIDFNGATAMASLYPGDGYVDWIGLDGYNVGDQYDQYHHWESFTQVFAQSVGEIEAIAPSKPLMIAETSSVESPDEPFASPTPSGPDAVCPTAPLPSTTSPSVAANAGAESKAEWILSAFAKEIPLAFPQIRAVVWFDQDNSADLPGVQQDYCVNSSPASEAAFATAVGADPLYSGAMPQ